MGIFCGRETNAATPDHGRSRLLARGKKTAETVAIRQTRSCVFRRHQDQAQTTSLVISYVSGQSAGDTHCCQTGKNHHSSREREGRSGNRKRQVDSNKKRKRFPQRPRRPLRLCRNVDQFTSVPCRSKTGMRPASLPTPPNASKPFQAFGHRSGRAEDVQQNLGIKPNCR